MDKYLSQKGVAAIGEKLQANKTAIDGALDLTSALSSQVEKLEQDKDTFTTMSAEEVQAALEEGANG